MKITFNQPNVADLFHVSFRYRVPRYQRGYAWGGAQIDAFWGDIATVGESGHFLGPMVLHDGGSTDHRDVIDGQQRLTTIQILIALIRDRYVALGDPDRDPFEGGEACSAAPQLLIWNGVLEKHFVVQSGNHNRRVLEDFVLRAPSDKRRRRPWGRPASGGLNDVQEERLDAIERVRNRALIDAWLRLDAHLSVYLQGSTDPVARLKRLEEGLYTRVSVGVLQTTDLEDAYLLFETLNDRGLRLSAADLLKSHLLARFDAKHANDETALETASGQWDDMVDELGGGDISGFLRHYLLLSNKHVRKTDVFPYFKRSVREQGPDKSLKELTVMGGHYADLIDPNRVESPPLKDALFDLAETSIDLHRVAMLPARRWVLDTKRLVKFARACEVLSFRWVVTGRNAQELEDAYQAAGSLISSSDGNEIDSAESGLMDLLPPDDQFRDAFAVEELGYQYVARYALRKLESALTDQGAKGLKAGGAVHVEHIMPRAETEAWRAQLAEHHVYEDIVQRWGNLTLLLGRVNSALSNGTWDTKRTGTKNYQGYSASDVTLTSDLANVEQWTSQDIDLRARWLAALAVRVWSPTPALGPLPRSFSDVKRDPTLLDPFWMRPAAVMDPDGRESV